MFRPTRFLWAFFAVACVQPHAEIEASNEAADSLGFAPCEMTLHLNSFVREANVAGFKGDNRGFGYDPAASSRVHHTVLLRRNGDNKWVVVDQRSYSSRTSGYQCERTATPVSTAVVTTNHGVGNVATSYRAADPCTPGNATPNLNLFARFSITQTGAEMRIAGTVKGDLFPDHEIYVGEHEFAQTLFTMNSEYSGAGGVAQLIGNEEYASAELLGRFDKTFTVGTVCYSAP